MPADRLEYWTRRHATHHPAHAVGHIKRTVEENVRQYAESRAKLKALIEEDFPNRDGLSVLDLGCGTGFYAQLCHEMGFARYVGVDFANVPDLFLGNGFGFTEADISKPLDLGNFDLVLCLDVAFHIILWREFATLLANIKTAAVGPVYITGLFSKWRGNRDRLETCHHRPLEEFSPLGGPVSDFISWRDVMLLKFRPNG